MHAPLLFALLNVLGAVYPLAQSPVVYPLNALWLYILSHEPLMRVQVDTVLPCDRRGCASSWA